MCPVLYLRSHGVAGAVGKGALLRGVRSRSRETVSLDPRSPEDPRPPEHLRRPAAAAGGALQHPLQGREKSPNSRLLKLQTLKVPNSSAPIMKYSISFKIWILFHFKIESREGGVSSYISNQQRASNSSFNPKTTFRVFI